MPRLPGWVASCLKGKTKQNLEGKKEEEDLKWKNRQSISIQKRL